MNKKTSKFPIPKNWTGQQATAIIRFLDEINTAIWNIHDEKILKQLEIEQMTKPKKKQKKETIRDNDYPF